MEVKDVIRRWKEANPDKAHRLGLHEYDGRLPDLSVLGIQKRIEDIKEDIAYLEEIELR